MVPSRAVQAKGAFQDMERKACRSLIKVSVTSSALKRVSLSLVGTTLPWIGSDAGRGWYLGHFSVPSGFAYYSALPPLTFSNY